MKFCHVMILQVLCTDDPTDEHLASITTLAKAFPKAESFTITLNSVDATLLPKIDKLRLQSQINAAQVPDASTLTSAFCTLLTTDRYSKSSVNFHYLTLCLCQKAEIFA